MFGSNIASPLGRVVFFKNVGVGRFRIVGLTNDQPPEAASSLAMANKLMAQGSDGQMDDSLRCIALYPSIDGRSIISKSLEVRCRFASHVPKVSRVPKGVGNKNGKL